MPGRKSVITLLPIPWSLVGLPDALSIAFLDIEDISSKCPAVNPFATNRIAAATLPPRVYNWLMDWIPVTDRLPPVGLNVLACSWLAKTYALAYVSPRDGKWYLSFGSTRSMNVTHWMPLPELPQGSAVV